MGLRRHLINRAADGLIDRASRAGWNPLNALRDAIQQECGFPPTGKEEIGDYVARAVGVSREMIDRYLERVQAGKDPLPEMASIRAFMHEAGKRVGGLKR
jgi:hypothetical protein